MNGRIVEKKTIEVIYLVVIPQLFWKTFCFSPVSGFSNVMSNILLKFWPR